MEKALEFRDVYNIPVRIHSTERGSSLIFCPTVYIYLLLIEFYYIVHFSHKAGYNHFLSRGVSRFELMCT
jgi:hypothetical protein